MVIKGDGKLAQWTSSGALATVAWFLVLTIYCVFRAFGIEDPLLGQAFLLLTGLWVGNLTLAQGKKNAKVEEKAERAETKISELESEIHGERGRTDALEVRATDSEIRETEWSKHKDHFEADGDESP